MERMKRGPLPTQIKGEQRNKIDQGKRGTPEKEKPGRGGAASKQREWKKA